jgi:hypothetical protein
MWMLHKERFVTCYIDKFPHFGNACTSRVEGNHHVIKSYLRVGTLHLLWRAPKSRGETHLRVSQSQVAEIVT